MAPPLRDILVAAAHIAGDVHRRVYARGDFDLESKHVKGSLSPSDVVTIADKESETALRAYFAKRLPDFNIFGEEYGAAYNGNGLVIVIDPLDGTALFRTGTPGFGPIIGVYVDGENIGGVMYDVLRDDMAVGTLKSGFERIGRSAAHPMPAATYDGSYFSNKRDELEMRVAHEFPGLNITKSLGLNGMRVFTRETVAHMHASLAWHDISAAPVLGKLTGVAVTDHRGRSYGRADPQRELGKYVIGTKAQMYSHPLLICEPALLEGLVRALEPFAEDIDKRQNPQ